MRIRLKINGFGSPTKQLIQEELQSRDLPPCLGNMIPLIIRKVVDFKEDEIMAHRNAVPVDEIGSEFTFENSVNYQQFCKDYVITQQGIDLLENYKKQCAKDYAEKISKCVVCELQDVCYKLTTNYLELIKLEEMQYDR